MAKGDFTPTELVEIQTTLEAKWKEPQFAKEYTPRGETAKAIKENSTATFQELENPDKQREVAVKWADWCDDTATTTTNTDACAHAGADEADPKTKTYALNTFLEDKFTVNQEDFQTSVLSEQEVVANGLMAKMKNLYELFNTKILAVMVANAGTNPLMTNPATGSLYTENADGSTEIPANEFDMQHFYPYVAQVLTLLRSSNNFMIDGSNFFQAAILAKANDKNADGKTDLQLFTELYPYYNDLLGMTRAGLQGETFLIDKGAMALANRVKWPAKPVQYSTTNAGSFTRYSIPFTPLPGFSLDVQYEQLCTGGNIGFVWNLKLRAGIFVNPILCDAGNTGVWSFKKLPAGQA